MPRFFWLLLLLLPACDTVVGPGDFPDTLTLSASATLVPAGESVVLSVVPQSTDGNPAMLASSTRLSFSLDAAGLEVAQLIGPEGSTSLEAISYAEVQAGAVRVRARPVTLPTSQSFTVTVRLASTPSVRADLTLKATPNGTFHSGISFTRLFAPPTSAELAAVRAGWMARTPVASGYRIDKEETASDGTRTLVVSHLVDGHRHFAAVRIPATSTAALPVVMLHHGGDNGADTAEYFDPTLLGTLRDRVILVLPSYRSEPLRAGGQTYRSEGTPSPWDRDVDDAIALLSVVLQHIPKADPARVANVGFSRGADVALLQALRDSRVDGVVEFFGPTDFTLPSIQTFAQLLLSGFPLPLPGVPYLRDTILLPLRNGTLSYDAARQELLRRSPSFFAADLPPLQVHHGTSDAVVPFEHGERLAAALQASRHKGFTFYSYSGGGHSVDSLPGAADRTRAFLTALFSLAL